MITKFSVKRAYTVIVGIVLVLILGAVAYTKMTVDLLPDLELPYAVIITTYPGASPEAVENGVTKPIEQAVATIDNIEGLQSVSSENYSMVVLEFGSDANMDTATIDMREKLDQISGFFDDSVGSPLILKLNPDMLPVMIAAVNKEGLSQVELSEFVENTIQPSLESLEGVASVTGMGLVEESVQVIVRRDKVKTVNKQVRKALDDKFADAEKALKEGKDKISSGKSQLASGQLTAGREFAKAEVELNNARYDLEKNEESAKEALAKLKEQEKELAGQKTQVEQAVKALDELLTSYQALSGQKAQLEAAAAMMPEDAAMAGQLQAVEAAMQAMEEKLAEQTDQEGNPLTFDGLPAYIASLQASLTQIKAGQKEIAKGKKQLNQGLKKITSGKEKVQDGYVELKEKQSETQNDMTKAQIELTQGEQELERQETNLEEAKDAAYEGADMKAILTSEMIKGILTAQNFEYPAGYVTEDDVDYLVRVGEKFGDLEQLSGFVLLDLGMEDVEPIKLSDVADVVMVTNEDEIYSRVGKNPGVILSIAKQNEYSTKAVADRIVERFEELSGEEGAEFVQLMNQGVYIDLVSSSVIRNLLSGALLAIMILLFFLKDIRPTGIIAVSIPVSVIFAVVLMYFSHITLNVISLSGLALGVGMLVDNSIVVIENIYRLRKEGYSVKDASIQGSGQMVGAITASTLTTVCVFLPIVFTTGLTRQIFTDMGLTIAYSLLASLIVAITFVPMVASRTFDRVSEKENHLMNRISGWYAGMLPGVLRHKGIVLLLALVLFAASAALSISKGFSFFPTMDSPQMTMTMKMPEGTKTLEETRVMSDQVIDRVLEISDVKTIGALTGGEGLSLIGVGSDDTIDTVSYYLECREDKTLSNEEIAKQIEEKTSDLDCEITVQTSTMDMSAIMTEGISIQVKGKDLDTLRELAGQIGKKLTEVQGLEEISDGLEKSVAEYRVIVDKNKAASYGLTVAQVYQEIQGKVADAAKATTLSTPSKDYSVYVKDDQSEDITMEDVSNLKLDGKKGEEEVQVKVKKIAEVQDAESLSSINRINQTRYIAVSAKVKDGFVTTAVSNEVKRLLDAFPLPSGYEIEFNGENETVMESLRQVVLMLILALAFMYLIMVAQFQSLKSPFIIMFTVPLAFTGGFAALYLTDKDVSIIAMVGMVMLSGIIVNNGIVFVDSVNQLREEGMEMEAAIVMTGRNRLRPIVMTALTTILGLSTLAMGIGMGADMAQPMALVTIGGLIYGTLLTLLVVPCIYEIFHHSRRSSQEVETGPEEDV